MNLRQFAILVTLVSLTGCSGQQPTPQKVSLSGAGSTFAERIIRKWAKEYHQRHPEVVIEYEGLGSGEGESLFLAEMVDFAGTDSGLLATELKNVSRGAIQVPVTAGIVVLAYNPDGLPVELKMPRTVFADIFLGYDIKWNDPRLRAANPGQQLPDHAITVVVRNDRSGTTFALTNHLAAVSDEWRDRFGEQNATGHHEFGVRRVDWPGAPLKASSNSGVAELVKHTPYSLGYIQYGAARELGLPMTRLENRAGNYIEAANTSGLETLLNAEMPPDLLGYFPDPEGAYSYPIVTFTWLLVFEKYTTTSKAGQVKQFVEWCLTTGQDYSEAAGNVRLAPHVIRAALTTLESVGA